jgi:hypothetical protein
MLRNARADSMKALTVWQPWASLIAWGMKPYEFRRWAAPASMIGQRIAIHAGARKLRIDEVYGLVLDLQRGEKGAALRAEAMPLLRQVLDGQVTLPHSHILCTVTLGRPIRATELPAEWADSERADHHVFGWPMLDIEPLTPPEPATGAQGFWHWGGA